MRRCRDISRQKNINIDCLFSFGIWFRVMEVFVENNIKAESLADFLVGVRERRDWSQRKLSQLLGVHYANITQVESGRGTLSVEMASNLSSLLLKEERIVLLDLCTKPYRDAIEAGKKPSPSATSK